MTKAWEITLVHRENGSTSFEPLSITKIEDDNIVGLLAQLQVAIAIELNRYHEQIMQELTLKDDDIPF